MASTGSTSHSISHPYLSPKAACNSLCEAWNFFSSRWLNASFVSRVADEVTRRLQPQNTEPLPDPALKSILQVTNQPRKLMTPRRKLSHWWSKQYFVSASPWQVSKTLCQGESSTPPIYQLTVRFHIKCEPRSCTFRCPSQLSAFTPQVAWDHALSLLYLYVSHGIICKNARFWTFFWLA